MHLAFIVLFVIDQITKVVYSSRDFFVLGFRFHPVKNYALPFGFDYGTMANFILLFVVYIVAGWFVTRIKNDSLMIMAGKSLFLSGAASNLADRLIYGYVRDYIDLNLGFVFNLADVFIILGLAIIMLVPARLDKEVEKNSGSI